MTAQRKKTGVTYQYETGRFDLDLTAAPFCLCVDPTCWGAISLVLRMKISLFGQFGVTGYTLVPGPGPSTPTTEKAGSAPPAPDVDVTIDEVDLPAEKPENRFQQPNPTKFEYIADAATLVPCGKGTYARRFYVVNAGVAGGSDVVPGTSYLPILFVDCVVVVTETEACELGIEMKAWLIEFIPGFDFDHKGKTPGGAAELPEVDYTESDGSKGKTRNIAKLIEEDGRRIDAPFPPK